MVLLSLLAASVVVGGPAYAEAQARAVAQAAGPGHGYSVPNDQAIISGAFDNCILIEGKPPTRGFGVVVTFGPTGKVETIYLSEGTPVTRCMVGRREALEATNAPLPDYTILMTFDP